LDGVDSDVHSAFAIIVAVGTFRIIDCEVKTAPGGGVNLSPRAYAESCTSVLTNPPNQRSDPTQLAAVRFDS